MDTTNETTIEAQVLAADQRLMGDARFTGVPAGDTELPERERLKEAFRAIRKFGYIAKMNYLCCGGCAAAGIWAQGVAKRGWTNEDTDPQAIYWHRQDEEAFNGMLGLDRELYVRWAGDGYFLIAVLRRFGLRAYWDGDKHTCIRVRPDLDLRLAGYDPYARLTYASQEGYELLAAHVPETKERYNRRVPVSPEVLEQIRAAAAEQGVTISPRGY